MSAALCQIANCNVSYSGYESREQNLNFKTEVPIPPPVRPLSDKSPVAKKNKFKKQKEPQIYRHRNSNDWNFNKEYPGLKKE